MELKRRSYGRLKTTASSCAKISQLRNELRKFCSPKPISQLGNVLRNEIHLRNFARCFTAMKPPPSTRVPLRKLKLHLRSCKPRCEITSKLRNKLQIISKLRNHLHVVKSQIQLAKSKFKLAKWTIQTCEIHLCKLRYLPPTKLDFFSRYFV